MLGGSACAALTSHPTSSRLLSLPGPGAGSWTGVQRRAGQNVPQSPSGGFNLNGRRFWLGGCKKIVYKNIFFIKRYHSFGFPQVVESTRVTRHKSAMAQRWEAGQYIRDED